MKTRWFISYPSRREDTTLIFFRALEEFDRLTAKIEMVWPTPEPTELAKRKIDLDHSQLLIIEVSVASMNTGLDLGLAYSANIPVIAFHQGAGVIAPIVPAIATSVHVYLTEQHIIKVLQTLA